MSFDPVGTDPMPGIPMVRVLDADGKEVMRGYYVCHINRQPGCCGGLRGGDVDHVVMHDGFADWHMPRSLEAAKITPPHTIEVIK